MILFAWLLKFGYFFSDDFTWFWQAIKIHSLGDVLTFRMASYYSPVLNLFYDLSYPVFHYYSAYYFLVTILVHILVSFFIYLLLDKILAQKRLAFIGALFFIIAGSAYEPVLWISANIHAFATFFILLMVYYYYVFLENNKFKYLPLVILYLILALCSKEIAVVSAPLLFLALLFFMLKQRPSRTVITRLNKILLILASVITAIYCFLEYHWQKNSSALNSGYWHFDVSQFLRWPVIIVDTFVPLFRWINLSNHVYFYIISLLVILGMIYYMRRSLLFWYGFFWMILASLPTIFAVDLWWMPLSSRYVYLPKIGAILILVAVLEKLFKIWPKKYIYLLLFGLMSYNLFYWIHIAKEDYPYVYQTGRSLTEIISQVGRENPAAVYMVYPFPFQTNHSQVVGAFSTLINYPEEKIIFLEEKQLPVDRDKNSAVIYWDGQNRKYFVKY